jgi:preprotein translocase subunit Sec61beta
MNLSRVSTKRYAYLANNSCSFHIRQAQKNINQAHDHKRLTVNIIRLVSSCLVMFIANDHCVAQTASTREYSMKAAFLYNFTQFVEWPDAAFTSKTAPFIIGILGVDPFKEIIDESVAGQKVGDHPIIVNRFAGVSEFKACHMLYVPEGEAGNFLKALPSMESKHMLTVSDAIGFANSGGMIRFYLEENKIKIQIHPAIAKAADLNISSKLLQLAEIIQ